MDLMSKKDLARKLYIEEGMNCNQISKDPRIDRDASRVYRWRDQGKWDDIKERKSMVSKILDDNETVKLSEIDNNEETLAVVLANLGINWDSSAPLSEEDLGKALTAIVKRLLKGALKDIVSGNVRYTDPYQVHQLLDMLIKEGRLSRGEPTEIRGHTLDVPLLDEDDIPAIGEGIRRLKMAAERRQLIEAEVVEEEDSDSGSSS